VPDDDEAAMTYALLSLVEDEPARRRMGAGALATAAERDLEPISRRWLELLAEL
jgi:hypothetical protein